MNDWAEYVTTAQAWSGGHGPGHILRGGTSDWSPPLSYGSETLRPCTSH